MKSKGRSVFITLIVICLCIGGILAYADHSHRLGMKPSNKSSDEAQVSSKDTEMTEDISLKEDLDQDEINGYSVEDQLDGIDIKDVKDINNILLIGCDARDSKEPSRSDSMMILTVDKKHEKLKLVSIIRDTYVDIPEHGKQKINHSFFFGGPELLIQTIEENFKIDIDHYVTINFFGFKDLIDAMGGLEVDIEEDEISPINDVICGTKKELGDIDGIDSEAILLEEAGLQHLNGLQTLAYARVRHVGNGDFDRMGRQRKVITLTIDKFKDTPVTKYPAIITKFLPYVTTDMDFIDIISYAYAVNKIGNFTPVQMQMPVNELSEGKRMDKKGWVLIMDQKQNIEILQDFIYEDKEYDKTLVDTKAFKEYIDTIATEAEK